MNKFYSRGSDIEYIKHDCVEKFIGDFLDSPVSFKEISDQIEVLKIKNVNFNKTAQTFLYQIIGFVYSKIMCHPNDEFEVSTIVTKNFFSNIIDFMHGKIGLHHSYMTDEIKKFGHSFCNQKVRENKNYFFLFLDNLFGCDFFYGERYQALPLENKNFSIGGTNLTNVNCGNIGENKTNLLTQ